MIFGNHLKDKAEETGENIGAGVGRNDGSSETQSQVIIPPSEGGSGSSVSIKGDCVMLGAAGDYLDKRDETVAFSGTTFEKRIRSAADKNSGVLIPLTGDDGFLLYNSARAGEMSRLPENSALPGMSELSAAVAMAKEQGLRVSAYMRSCVDISGSESDIEWQIAADTRVAADAAEAGFDEIIISSLVDAPEDITGESSHIILKYLNQMTSASGETEVGLSLPTSVYLDAKLSPQIELFISRSVFLAMELTGEQSTVEYMNFVCENLAGTLSVYNMRILFSPVDTRIGKNIEDKLEAVEHENYLYACVPNEPPKAPVEETTGGEEIPEESTADS